MDFTLKIYKKFLHSLLTNDYSFRTLENFIEHPNKEKIVILRHDVDRLPGNALVFAKIEKEAGIKASYYFRIVKQSYDENIIRQIAELGHEIGYHYENLSEINCLAQRRKGAKKDKKTGKRIEDRENRKENPQILQINADFLISHRRTQTHTDICPADIAGQKESSLREKEKTEVRGQRSEVGGQKGKGQRSIRRFCRCM